MKIENNRKNFISLPLKMLREVIKNSKMVNEVRIYLFLNFSKSSSCVYDSNLIKEAATQLNLSTRTVSNIINRLIEFKWLGYNALKKKVYLRSLDTIRKSEGWKDQRAIFCYYSWILKRDKFKAFVYASLCMILIKSQKQKSISGGTYLGTYQARMEREGFYPIANSAFAAFYGVSKTKSYEWRRLAKKFDMIKVLKNQKKLMSCKSSHAAKKQWLEIRTNDKERGDRIFTKGNEVYESMPDLVKCELPLKSRKKI